jgi:hypothetical protein
MKLTTVEFRGFIHNYKSLPSQVIESYGFTPDELPSDDRKRAFNQLSKWYKATETWLRYLLLIENEYLFEVKSKSLIKYRPFAHEKKQFFELIRAITLSNLIETDLPILSKDWNCEGLFCASEWETCETKLLDSGILGNKPKPLESKTRHYEAAKFFHEYFDDPKPSRIFQKDDVGKVVPASSLKLPELDSKKFVLIDSTEPQRNFNYEVGNLNYIHDIIFYLGHTQDFYIAEAMSAYTKASKKRARAVLGDETLVSFVVKDELLEFSRSKKPRL